MGQGTGPRLCVENAFKPISGTVMISRIRLPIKFAEGGDGFTANISAGVFEFSVRDLKYFTDYHNQLSLSDFDIEPAGVDVGQNVNVKLGIPSFLMDPGTLDIMTIIGTGYVLELSQFDIAPNGIEYVNDSKISLNGSNFDFSAKDMTWLENLSVELNATEFTFDANELSYELIYPIEEVNLLPSTFNLNSQELSMAGQYTIRFDTVNGAYSGEGLVVRLGGVEVAQVSVDGSHEFQVLSGGATQTIEFSCKSLNGFIGDVDNVELMEGFV